VGDGDRWFSACLADDDIERTAARLGLDVVPGSRTRPDGAVVSWRGAGIEAPTRPNWLPFFIEWNISPELHPGRAQARHGSAVTGIARVDVAGDPGTMRRWLGDANVPIEVRPGEPAEVRAVAISTDDGDEILIGQR
jgi:Glyoxalase-like domain